MALHGGREATAAMRGGHLSWNPTGFAAASIQGPKLEVEGSVREAVEQLLELTRIVYESRGAARFVEFAQAAVEAGARAPLKPGEQGYGPGKLAMRALADLAERAGALPDPKRGGMTATRGSKVRIILTELPAPAGTGKWVQTIGKDGLDKLTDDPRRAMKAYEHFVARFPEFDDRALDTHTVAKTTPRKSLRDPQAQMIAKTIPDIGAALLLAALVREGFNEDPNETPKANLAFPRFSALIWAEHVVQDLRSVLDEQNPKIRGEAYSPLVEKGDGTYWTSEGYYQLCQELAPIEFSTQIATYSQRKDAERTYRADKERFDRLKAQYHEIQRKAGLLQAQAVAACDLVTAYIRHAMDFKLWQRDARGQEAGRSMVGGVPREGRRPAPAPRPAEGDFQFEEPAAVPQPVQQGGEGQPEEEEYRYIVRQHDSEWLALHGIEADIEARTHSIEGLWNCNGYPGQLWKVVVGPTPHALDFDDWDNDDLIVVIAPVKDGGGVEFSEKRAMRLAEFRNYFRSSDSGSHGGLDDEAMASQPDPTEEFASDPGEPTGEES